MGLINSKKLKAEVNDILQYFKNKNIEVEVTEEPKNHYFIIPKKVERLIPVVFINKKSIGFAILNLKFEVLSSTLFAQVDDVLVCVESFFELNEVTVKSNPQEVSDFILKYIKWRPNEIKNEDNDIIMYWEWKDIVVNIVINAIADIYLSAYDKRKDFVLVKPTKMEDEDTINLVNFYIGLMEKRN